MIWTLCINIAVRGEQNLKTYIYIYTVYSFRQGLYVWMIFKELTVTSLEWLVKIAGINPKLHRFVNSQWFGWCDAHVIWPVRFVSWFWEARNWMTFNSHNFLIPMKLAIWRVLEVYISFQKCLFDFSEIWLQFVQRTVNSPAGSVAEHVC